MQAPAGLARIAAALIISLLATAVPEAYGQEMEPRSYTNTPVGLNFLIVGYGYTEGSVGTDASLPVTDLELHTHSALAAYVRALDLWGLSGKVDVVLQHAWLAGSAKLAGDTRDREVSGLADPRFRLSVNFYGAPALSLEEFAHYEQDLVIGASLQVTVPGGQYDPDKLVNIGTNRWSFKPELGVSKTLGPVTLELIPAIRFYTDNGDFFGGRTRKQDPIYSVQGHVICSFGRGIWAALNGTYYAGGRTTVNGATSDDRQENVRIGLTLSMSLDRHFSVKLYASTGAYSRIEGNFTTVGLVGQYRWGGGL